jgi:glycine dehydrogenase subunit 1
MNYAPHTSDDRRAMLERIGVASVNELFSDIPENHRYPDLDLPDGKSEMEVVRAIRRYAGGSRAAGQTSSFAGAGAYHHFIPAVVNALSSRGEFATAYTPYQAEASQGTLQAIYEYQSMLASLLEVDVVNASHYDGATSLAEACLMAVRTSRGTRDHVLVSPSVHPEHIDVVRTYADAAGVAVDGYPDERGSTEAFLDDPRELINKLGNTTAAVVIQNPDFFGRLHDLRGVAEKVHEAGALLILHIDPIAAALFHSPGSLGADIVTGEGQALGIPVSFGGPYLGIFGCTDKLVRRMPGRLVGETRDIDGATGYVLTLNTREQHIRREKATSNICTNQGLMALRASIYLAAMGPEGLREAAELSYQKAHYAAERIGALAGFTVDDAPFFKEFRVTTPGPAGALVRWCAEHGVIAGVALDRFFPESDRELLIAVTETATREDIDALVAVLEEHS